MFSTSNSIVSTNPFLGQLLIETKQKKDLVERSVLTDKNGVEVGAELNKIEHVDKEEFIKVFARWLPQFFDLTASGFKVWTLIAMDLRPGQHEAYLHHSAASIKSTANLKGQACLMTQATFYRGIRNLLSLDFIAKKNDGVGSGWFYINPSAFFVGDRVKFAKTYMLEHKNERGPKVKVFNPHTAKREILK